MAPDRIRFLIENAEAMAKHSRGEYTIRVALETAQALRELLALREERVAA